MDPQAINRFVSTLAGAFRSFYIYNQDNKAFEEILQNLVKRFQDTQKTPQPIQLVVTNRSLLFQGEPVGFPELTVSFAGLLRNLGYRSIQFQAPLQSRNIFQLLHILTGKDSSDSKNEKLVTLLDDGEPKPVSLVPMTANSYLLKLSDEAITKRFAPVLVPKSQNGFGYVEQLNANTVNNLADFYAHAIEKAKSLPVQHKTFLHDFINAAREGYFPWERFSKFFPIPVSLKNHLREQLDQEPTQNLRKESALGHRFVVQKVFSAATRKVDWESRLCAFSTEEVNQHHEFRSIGLMSSAAQDLDLAAALLQEGGSNFIFGLSLLLRCMSERNSVPIQEKSLKLAIEAWTACTSSDTENPAVSLIASLRQQLTSLQNIGLVLFPLRSCTLESSAFTDMSNYFRSLGKACLPGLVKALDGEQDRGMRKKLCVLLTNVAREDGADVLVESLAHASAFLTRNLVMILGDIRASQLLPASAPLLTHPQKIVRSEMVRALCRIGSDESQRALLNFARSSQDADLKQVAVQVLSQTKYRDAARAA